jgi:hypothetical protein
MIWRFVRRITRFQSRRATIDFGPPHCLRSAGLFATGGPSGKAHRPHSTRLPHLPGNRNPGYLALPRSGRKRRDGARLRPAHFHESGILVSHCASRTWRSYWSKLRVRHRHCGRAIGSAANQLALPRASDQRALSAQAAALSKDPNLRRFPSRAVCTRARVGEVSEGSTR